MEQNQTTTTAPRPEFMWVDTAAGLLDNKFKIPFTNIRFGVDFLIGLIPGIGDWLGLSLSVILVIAIMRHGISITMMLRMIFNIVLDFFLGLIPFLGDLIDLRVKANRRNVEMLRQYYAENPNPPSAIRSFFVIFVCFLIAMGFAIWGVWLAFSAILDKFWSMMH